MLRTGFYLWTKLAPLLVALLVVVSPAAAAEPLHKQVDALLAAKASGQFNGPASDAEFCRRVHLDLIGRIPTRVELQTFVGDQAADKRAKLVDALLASKEHPTHFATAFHVLLTERLGEHEEWQAWLLESFRQNKPWDQMVREMLAPHLEDDPARGAGMFLSKRLENYGENPVDYPGLVRDVGRLFLGVDLQCAQCHDHPQVDDYLQVDYQGLYAYFQNVKLNSGAKYPSVAEQPLAAKIEFQSVFFMEKHEVALRVPFGQEKMLELFEKGQEFATPPDKKTNHPGVLKFSPLRILANDLPRGNTPGFSKNIVNRLWWQLMGCGLVMPLDLHHTHNPASHPELLELLGSDFVAHQFDMRYLIRELALCEAYQRSSLLPEGSEPIAETSYRVAIEKGLSAEQMARSLWTATGPWPDEKPLADLTANCVKALALPPREPEVEFAPSVKGALFLSHDAAVLNLLTATDGNLVARLLKATDNLSAIDEAYAACLSRVPSDAERVAVNAFLEQHTSDHATAWQQVVWALLSSNEFAINH
jgi:hypothetical protein